MDQDFDKQSGRSQKSQLSVRQSIKSSVKHRRNMTIDAITRHDIETINEQDELKEDYQQLIIDETSQCINCQIVLNTDEVLINQQLVQ